ncbi:MAG: hypothetical protein OEM32_06610 [Acidimicrobiia bacterium]|nr:hypothetical protein [Acidimicrobiia bacterium]
MREVRLDDAALLATELMEFGGPMVGEKERFQVQFLLNDHRATLAYESFPENSTVNWAFWHDEVHVVTGGSAAVTYTLPPNHRKQVTKTFEAGQAYLIPNGTRARFDVGEAPYIHFCVIMPRFEYTKDERYDTYG